MRKRFEKILLGKYWLIVAVSLFISFSISLFTFIGVRKAVENRVVEESVNLVLKDSESKILLSKNEKVLVELLKNIPNVKSVRQVFTDFKKSKEMDKKFSIFKTFIFPDKKVSLLIKLDKDAILEKANETAFFVVSIVFVIASVLLVLLIFIIKKFYLNPLSSIKKDIERVSRGEIEILPETSNDEFGLVRKKINDAISEIKKKTCREAVFYQFIHLLTAGKGFNGEFIELLRKLITTNNLDGIVLGLKSSKEKGKLSVRIVTLKDKVVKYLSESELDGISGYVYLKKKEFELSQDKEKYLSSEERNLGMKTAYALPLEIFSNTLGYVIFFRTRSVPFEEEEKEYLKNIGKSIAAAAELKLLIESLENKIKEEEELFKSTIQSLIRGIEIRDSYTRGHSERVAYLSKEIAERLGKGKEFAEKVYLAALLHDIGKIGIPDSILLKPAKLTNIEFDIIKLHPVLSYELLKGIKPIEDVLPAIKCHHERIDGSGYPEGLKDKEIPLEARIIAVADSFDAMVSDRIYKRGLPKEKAIRELVELAGKKYDADVVHAAVDVLKAYDLDRGKSQLPGDLSVIEQRRLDYFFRDSLTGVFNRNYIYFIFDKFINEGVKEKIVDIDILRLRNINKEKGWKEGDRIIKEVAAKIEEYLKPTCTVRFSGDNFVLFLREDTDRENILSKIKQIEKEVGVSLSVHFLDKEFKKPEELIDYIGHIETSGYES